MHHPLTKDSRFFKKVEILSGNLLGTTSRLGRKYKTKGLKAMNSPERGYILQAEKVTGN